MAGRCLRPDWPVCSNRRGPAIFPMCFGLAKETVENGAPDKIRTRDPLITNQVLYQLSYKGLASDLLRYLHL